MGVESVIDTFQTGSYQVKRTGIGPVVDGIGSPGAVSYFTVNGSLRPGEGGNELQNEAEGFYGLDVSVLYTKDRELWIERSSQQPDIVQLGTTPAVLDLGPLTPDIDSVLATIAIGGTPDVVTFQLVAGAVAQAGVLDESAYPAIVYTFAAALSTVADLEAAIAASSFLAVKTPGTAAHVLQAGDAHAAAAFSGGDGESYRVVRVKRYRTYWKCWLDRLTKP